MSIQGLLYVPTNRAALPAIRKWLEEAAWAHRHVQPTLFCLIENQLDSKTSREHLELLDSQATDGAPPCLRLDESRAEHFVDSITDRLDAGSARERVKELLLPRGVSYGRGPNLASLLAAAVGCSVVHRRDSDVYPDETHHQRPIALELEVVGKPLSDLEARVRRVSEYDAAPDARALVVGTSSFGAPTLDRRDLAEAGSEFLTDFQRLGRPESDRDEVWEEAARYFFSEPSTRYAEDFLEIDIDNRVEMESCSFAEVFRHIPEMPTDIMGCDYMTKDLVWRARDGLVFHSRKVHHRYTPERDARADHEARVYYVLRDVMYLQIGRLWQAHNENMQAFWKSNRGIEAFDASVYADSFLEASTAGSHALVQVRTGAQEVLAAAAAASRGDVAHRLQAASAAVQSAGEELDDHVRSAVSDYSFLVKAWERLVDAATATQLPPAWLEN